jgi:hypothetical protein
MSLFASFGIVKTQGLFQIKSNELAHGRERQPCFHLPFGTEPQGMKPTGERAAVATPRWGVLGTAIGCDMHTW